MIKNFRKKLWSLLLKFQIIVIIIIKTIIRLIIYSKHCLPDGFLLCVATCKHNVAYCIIQVCCIMFYCMRVIVVIFKCIYNYAPHNFFFFIINVVIALLFSKILLICCIFIYIFFFHYKTKEL